MTDHQQLAADLFNHTWTLLDIEERTKEQDEEMVQAAHASRYHWGIAGTEKNNARGEWQIARVYATLHRPDSAIHHATLCLEACQKEEFDDWDLPFAYEGLARAYIGVDTERAKEYLQMARELGSKIDKNGDRDWLYTNLDEIEVLIHGT